MKKVFKLFGFLCVSIIISTTELGQTQPTLPEADKHLCQITRSNGKTEDLTSICGKSSNDMNSIPQIDPNTPSTVILVGSPTPSKLWDTLPDLKQPPEAGKTEPMKPSSKSPTELVKPTDPSF